VITVSSYDTPRNPAAEARLMASVLTSLEIAQAARLRPIVEVAADLGLGEEEIEPYGRHKAKIPLDALDRRLGAAPGKLVAVTAITPTMAGEGKTTTAIGLADALALTGRRTVLCLREPSVGPVFGIKGGGAGGGRAQVVPMEDLNLHFTGDIHAVGAATNLLAAIVDAHVYHGNGLGIDPEKISWRRALDVNDRALRASFDITAASEVMGLLAIARDLGDLRARLGRITVARTVEGVPVTAEDVGAAGAMTVLLKTALQPNLIQTLEGRPALVHVGPFANIAHGNNSLVADRLALRLADYVVTESGFGADMGFEKLADIVCRLGGLTPSAVVLVATVRALKHHGGDPGDGIGVLRHGSANLARHIEIVRGFGITPVVAINGFPGDRPAELEAARNLALEHGALAAEIIDVFTAGGAGAVELAKAVVEAAAGEPPEISFAYELGDPIESKIRQVAKRVYGAADVAFSPEALQAIALCEREGLDTLPVCMAKTPLSLSHDPALTNSPRDFVLPVRELRAYTGAGWLVALCGELMTMPGLPAQPSALRIDIDESGRTVGLL
jgi:formate--tetrahydrofolate ligase